MKSPDETALVPNDTLYTYLSGQGPIKMKLSDQAALNGPPVDGVKGSFEKMFMWANNVTSLSLVVLQRLLQKLSVVFVVRKIKEIL